MTPKASPSWLPLAAVACTLVFWASAFVAIRHLGDDFSAGALSLGRLLVGAACLAVMAPLPRCPATDRPPVGLDRPDRRALVRALQRGPQRGRAHGRRRHCRDADPGLSGADRAAGGDVPRRAVHRAARRRPRAGVRRRRADLGLDLRRRQQRPRRRTPLPGQRRRLLDQPDPPEAAGRQARRRPRDLAGLHDRRDQLPAVRRRPGRPGRRTPRPRRSGGSSTSASSPPRSPSRRTPSRSST